MKKKVSLFVSIFMALCIVLCGGVFNISKTAKSAYADEGGGAWSLGTPQFENPKVGVEFSAIIDYSRRDHESVFTLEDGENSLSAVGLSFVDGNKILGTPTAAGSVSFTVQCKTYSDDVDYARHTFSFSVENASTFTVTYNGNGATGGDVPTDSSTYENGANVTVLGNTGNLVKTNYTFAGWNTSAEGDGTTYQESSSFTMPNNSIVLYAMWTVASYSVTLNTNNGTIAFGHNVESYTFGIGATLPSAEFISREGYIFNGWFDNETFDGDAVTVILTTDSGDKDFWASWTEKTTVVLTEDAQSVTYNGNPQAFELKGTHRELSFNIEYKLHTANDDAYNSTAPTSAGVYDVKITRLEDATYKSYSNVLSLTIEKATYDMTGAGWDYVENSFSYDNSAKTVSVTGLPTGVTVDSYTDNKKTDAGSYTAKVVLTCEDTTNYVVPTISDLDWQISKAANSVSNLSIEGWTYGDSANDPTGTATFGTIVYKYSNTEEGTYTDEVPTLAGTYYLKAIIVESANYSAYESVAQSFVIEQRTAILTWTELTMTDLIYSGTAKTLTASVSNLVSGDSCGVTVALTDGKSNINVGTFTYTAMALDNENYKLPATKTSPEYTITAKAVDVLWSGDTFTYTGNEQTLTAKYIDVNSAEVALDVTFAEGKTFENVDTYSVTASFKNGETNYVLNSPVKQFSISKAANSVSNLSIDGWTYGDSANNPTATATFGTIVYKYSNSETGTYADEVPTLAGTYYLKATIVESANYSAYESAVQSFVIEQRTAILTWTELADADLVYTGTAKTLTASVSNLVSGDSCGVTVALTDGKSNINVGTFTYTAMALDNENYKLPATKTSPEYTITQAQNIISGLTIENWACGETEKTPTATANFGTIVYTYADTIDGTYSQDVPTVPGTYYVKASVVETPNYKGYETDAVEFIITKSIQKITNIPDISKVYDGLAVTAPTFNYLGEGNVTIEYKLSGEGEYSTTAPKDAGEYTVRISVEETTTYSSGSETKDFSISQREVELLWSDIELEDLIYDGEAKVLTASVLNLVDGESCNVLVSLTEGNDNINVGTFTYTATALDNENYKLPAVTTSPENTITIKMVSVVWSETLYTYTGTEQTISAKYVDINGTEVALIVTIDEEKVFKDVGTYFVTANLKNGEINYALTNNENQFTISQADNEISGLTIENWSSGETAKTPTATATFGIIVYTYCDEEDGVYSSEIPTELGTYYVKAEVVETENYKGCFAIKSFEIEEPKAKNNTVLIVSIVAGVAAIGACSAVFIVKRKKNIKVLKKKKS